MNWHNKIAFLPRKWRKTTLISLLSLAIFITALTAYADWYTIVTTDHQVDSNWAAVGEWDPSLACDDSSIDDKYEMNEAYVTQDGTYLYFRLDTCAVPSMSKIQVYAATDCNNDGDVTDAMQIGNGKSGDRIIVYDPDNDGLVMYDGTYATDPQNAQKLAQFQDATLGEWMTVSGHAVFEWRIKLQAYYPGCRGSASDTGIQLGTIDTQNHLHQDSSTLNTWNNPMDYGDAPGSWDYSNETCKGYNTVLPYPCDGPRHGNLAGGLMLGAAIDADEGGGQPPKDALDDDTHGATPDDEDGVEATPGVVWTSGGTGSIDATVSGGNGYLNCWIDWNDDDDFEDSGENIVNDVAVNQGKNTLTFSVPSSVSFSSNPAYYVRCRLAPNSGEANTLIGPVWGGEVEDYRWLPQAVTADISLSNGDVKISWNNLSQYTDYKAYRSNTPYSTSATLSALGTVSSSPYTDSGVAGDTSIDTFFYRVVGRKTVDSTLMESTLSNEVGLFEFELTPGS